VAIFCLFSRLLTKEEAMSIQNLVGNCTADGRLGLAWETYGTPIAISVQVALDTEFTHVPRTFILPKDIKSCALDVGRGKWYYRLGAWVGTDVEGVIDWSGIYGPVSIMSQKEYPPLQSFPTTLTSVTPALNAIVFHTGLYETYYMIVQYTSKEDFRASGLKSIYRKDWGSGTVHVPGLDPNLTYSFQLQMLCEEKGVLPKTAIRLLTEPCSVKNKRAGMPVRAGSTVDQVNYAADKAILQDAVGRQKLKFTSYSDYWRFQAAKARTSARQE
jgi:hypothetical protein